MWNASITTQSEKNIEYDESKLTAISFSENISGSDSYPFGAVSSRECKLSAYDRLTNANSLYYANVSMTKDNTKVGAFICNEPTAENSIISLNSYDELVYANQPITGLISGNTYGALAESICINLGLTLKHKAFAGADKVCVVPDYTDMTYHDLLEHIAKATCNNVRVDDNGEVEFYYLDSLMDIVAGGIFDDGLPSYVTGADVSGGTFAYDDGDECIGNTFEDLAKYYLIQDAYSLNVGADSVTVTGIKVMNGDVEYLAGTAEYAIEIKDNPFTVGNESEYAEDILQVLSSITIRSFDADIPENISIRAGDAICIEDAEHTAYMSYATDVTHTIQGTTKVRCEVASPMRKELRANNGTINKIIRKAEENTKRHIETYDEKAQNMTSLISQGFGLYSTTIQDGNGAVKQYLHDAPTIEESSVVWTRTAQGLLVSKDGATTWAIDANGNALFNLLMVHGLSADWVHIGGQGNGDGTLAVKDKDGNVIVLINNAGITMADGTSIISASGVCGDLTFTSGGTPYDLGFDGNIAIYGFTKREVYLQANIPSNYIITSAELILSMCGTQWNNVWDISGDKEVINSCVGYPRAVRAYIGSGQVYKSADWDGEYIYSSAGVMSQIISGEFASAGVDGSSTVNPKQVKSGNIKDLLKPGLNTIRFSPADFSGSTNLSYAQRTGTATALLSVKGYTRN